MKKRRLVERFFMIGILFILLLNLSSFYAQELKVTSEHPFLINGKWIPASQLHVGDLLTTAEGKTSKIMSIKKIVSTEAIPVYNLEADIYHNFIVNGDVVVHNSNNPRNNFRCYQCEAQCPFGNVQDGRCGGLPTLERKNKLSGYTTSRKLPGRSAIPQWEYAQYGSDGRLMEDFPIYDPPTRVKNELRKSQFPPELWSQNRPASEVLYYAEVVMSRARGIRTDTSDAELFQLTSDQKITLLNLKNAKTIEDVTAILKEARAKGTDAMISPEDMDLLTRSGLLRGPLYEKSTTDLGNLEIADEFPSDIIPKNEEDIWYESPINHQKEIVQLPSRKLTPDNIKYKTMQGLEYPPCMMSGLTESEYLAYVDIMLERFNMQERFGITLSDKQRLTILRLKYARTPEEYSDILNNKNFANPGGESLPKEVLDVLEKKGFIGDKSKQGPLKYPSGLNEEVRCIADSIRAFDDMDMENSEDLLILIKNENQKMLADPHYMPDSRYEPAIEQYMERNKGLATKAYRNFYRNVPFYELGIAEEGAEGFQRVYDIFLRNEFENALRDLGTDPYDIVGKVYYNIKIRVGNYLQDNFKKVYGFPMPHKFSKIVRDIDLIRFTYGQGLSDAEIIKLLRASGDPFYSPEMMSDLVISRRVCSYRKWAEIERGRKSVRLSDLEGNRDIPIDFKDNTTPDPSDAAAKNEYLKALDDALAGDLLTDSEKQLIRQIYYQGSTVEEVADSLNEDPEALQGKLGDILSKLKNALGGNCPTSP
ncbi:MAG: polymorphic toxin-type HINT domain-containing protein [Candidatus Nanoarchaeia archaeon]|nr:polymorphic toxin-type HINT domain-containing protein [Candidatus Nanoarchaeia archaeon]